jgi:hypothetical protein
MKPGQEVQGVGRQNSFGTRDARAAEVRRSRHGLATFVGGLIGQVQLTAVVS